jgi:WD40 repeat protein
MKIIIILSFFILFTSQSQAGDIIYQWHKTDSPNKVLDISFLKGGDRFAALLEYGEFQIRDTETGEIINSFNNVTGYFNLIFELTPDSNRVIIANTSKAHLSLYNLDDMTVINKTLFEGETLSRKITAMVVDPVRPYVYFLLYGEKGHSPYIIRRGRISVYNYETMELVKHITDLTEVFFSCIDISPDGRYLAYMNYGDTYLTVWDLEESKVVTSYRLYDPSLGDMENRSCWPKEIKFSKVYPEKIYFTGVFPRLEHGGKEILNGFFIFDMNNEEFFNGSFNDNIGSKLFVLFDNEQRIMHSSGTYLSTINLETSKIEFKTDIYDIDSLGFAGNLDYNNECDCFIGSVSRRLASIKYDRETHVNPENDFEEIVYPNPTNSSVTIYSNCGISTNAEYQILNNNGEIVGSSVVDTQSSEIIIDFHQYPAGFYFIRLICADEIFTYKVIRVD